MNIIRTGCVMATAALVGLAASAVSANSNSADDSQNGQQQNAQQQYDQQRQQNAQDEQSQAQENQSQNDQSENQSRLSGVVQVYREVNTNGTPHFRARISTPQGRLASVDLGPSSQNQDLIDNIEQGDHISLQGRTENQNGKRIFVADRVRLDGKTYAVNEGNNGNSDQSENQARDDNRRENDQEANSQNQQNQQQPRQVVLLDERFVFYNEGDLNRHLILAKENLRMGNTQAAAGELRVAADRIEMYAKSAQGKSARDLSEASQELNRLGSQIAKGGGNLEPREIDQAAARAQVALAEFYDHQARNQKGNGQSVEAGYALQSAAVHARQALMWSDENVSSDAARSIRQALRSSDDLIEGNAKQDKVSQVAQNLSREIGQIDQQISEGQAQPASANQPAEQNQNRSQQQQQQQQRQQQQEKSRENSGNSPSANGG